jgi:hypothetical protein
MPIDPQVLPSTPDTGLPVKVRVEPFRGGQLSGLGFPDQSAGLPGVAGLLAAVCKLSVRLQGGPPGRTRRRLGVLAYAHADAPAPAGPTPVGWRVRRNTGRSTRSKFHRCTWVVPAPAAGLSGAGQDPSRPSVTAGQPHPSSCLANVHAKTALTEPARTRRLQLSEAGTRMACGLTLKRQPEFTEPPHWSLSTNC